MVVNEISEDPVSCCLLGNIKRAWNWTATAASYRITTQFEPPHGKTSKVACARSKDSDQPRHPTSLISLRCALKGSKLSSCGKRRLWSDWADAQAYLSLRWAHSHFADFVMRRLILILTDHYKRIQYGISLHACVQARTSSSTVPRPLVVSACKWKEYCPYTSFGVPIMAADSTKEAVNVIACYLRWYREKSNKLVSSDSAVPIMAAATVQSP